VPGWKGPAEEWINGRHSVPAVNGRMRAEAIRAARVHQRRPEQPGPIPDARPDQTGKAEPMPEKAADPLPNRHPNPSLTPPAHMDPRDKTPGPMLPMDLIRTDMPPGGRHRFPIRPQGPFVGPNMRRNSSA